MNLKDDDNYSEYTPKEIDSSNLVGQKSELKQSTDFAVDGEKTNLNIEKSDQPKARPVKKGSSGSEEKDITD